MYITKKFNLKKDTIIENSIGLTDERASEHYIKFQDNVFGSLSSTKSNSKKTLKVNNLYLVEPVLKSKEFCITNFGVARGDWSGAVFDMSNYLFRNSDYIVLTKVELYNASQYEWWGTLYTKDGNISFNGGTTVLNRELRKSDNVRLEVPNSANWWYARFYGYIVNPVWLGKDIEMVQKNYEITWW